MSIFEIIVLAIYCIAAISAAVRDVVNAESKAGTLFYVLMILFSPITFAIVIGTAIQKQFDN